MKKLLLIGGMVMVGVIITIFIVLGAQKSSASGNTKLTTSTNNQTTKTTTNAGQYTLVQIQTHNKASDCWTAVNGTVYDVSKYVTGGMHPGGSRILQACGVDATDLFSGGPGMMSHMHSSMALAILNQYKIGTLQ